MRRFFVLFLVLAKTAFVVAVEPFSFIGDGDVQIGFKWQEQVKLPHVQSILALVNKPDFLIIPGDLTDKAITPEDGRKRDQLSRLLSEYINPLEAGGIPVRTCLGNHDLGSKGNDVDMIQWVTQREGGAYYSFVHKGVRFICCSIYPNQEIRNWMATVPNDLPVIVYWHYNVDGPYSVDPNATGGSWWPMEDREAVFDLLTSRFDTKAVLVGHYHVSYDYTYRGIPILLCGEQFVHVSVQGDGSISWLYSN